MQWLLANWPDVLIALWQHITISITALVISFALSLLIGMLTARRERLYAAVMTVTGIFYTLPTLALLAFLIPFFGLGRVNAIITMVAFSMMILIRSVVTGMREVSAEVLDAARGMGMSRWQIMRGIELPLALPLIIAGLRVAAVTIISVTVVAAFISAGGLGTLIFTGISNNHTAKIWTGALTVCALAVAVDILLALAEQKLRRRYAA